MNESLKVGGAWLKANTIRVPDGKIACYRCGELYEYGANPALWFPAESVHEFTQSLPINTFYLCCGAASSTEIVATVSAYLRDVKGHARLMCNLVNQHLLAGRPQPEWLTKAWKEWESSFTRPKFRSR